ncbi:hypothetical protein TNCV_5001521 [Trichonephila clavipes]|nr:hypothetical protein TNCV_5001521 [Trichonephila clavipes]
MVGRHILGMTLLGESPRSMWTSIILSDNGTPGDLIAWRWSSAPRLNRGFITEDDRVVSSLSHSKLPEVGKNPVDTACDAGSAASVLADAGFLKPTSVKTLLYGFLDGTGCLEAGSIIAANTEQLPLSPDSRWRPIRLSRPTCFSEAYYTDPSSKSGSAARTATGYVLKRHPKSHQYRLSALHQDSFG